MKVLNYVLGVFFSLAIILILLLTTVQLVALKDLNFYKNEYINNNVYENISISEENLMYVTQELINYMDGKREDLRIITVVDEEQKEFFNQREKDHMVDVRNLIIGGKKLRMTLIGISILLLAVMKVFKAPIRHMVPRSVVATISVVTICGGILGAIISKDFTKAFTVFHEILFTNTLWILDYSTDRLLNMVPENFFIHIATRIGIMFGCMILLVFIVSLIFILKGRKKNV